ncbi:MAG: DUF951 domain-containing protein [Firmicutes bacterium]|nr:DUF951 domain-containing protein [Bacillota bacterium]
MDNYTVGQRVQMKKGHPCGANSWLIIRVGMDFRLKCENCGRSVLIPRSRFVRRVKTVFDPDQEQED